MDDSTQDPFGPLNELKKPMNIISAIRELQAAGQADASAEVQTLEEITGNDTGTVVVDEIIAPAPDVEVLDPEDLSFYGAGMTGGGRTFGSEIMNFWAVGAGVLQAGFNNLGKFTFGAGAGSLSVDGLAITIGTVFDAVKAIKFNHSSGVTEGYFSVFDSGTTSQGRLWVDNSATGSSLSRTTILDIRAASEIGAVLSLAAISDASAIGNPAGIQIESSSSQSKITLNINTLDVDTIIKGDVDAALLYADASADRIGIGTATPAVKLDVVGDGAFSGSLSVGGGVAISIVDQQTFTPSIIGTTAAGVGTYTTQLGEYYVIGKLVYFELLLVWTAHTGTGNMQVDGLPFAKSNNGIGAACAVQWSNITLLAAGNKLVCSVINNASTIGINEVGSGAVSAVPIDAAAILRLSGSYLRA